MDRKPLIEYPIVGLTPMELRALDEQARQTPIVDPMSEEFLNAPGGRFLTGARNTMVGRAGWRLGQAVVDIFDDSYSEPLNFSKTKDEVDALRDPMSWGMDNNIDGLIRDLEGVPEEEVPYLLSAGSYGDFKDRLLYVKSALPEMQAQGSNLGYAMGLAGDIAAFTAVGLSAERLMFMGLPTQAMAGRAAASSFGTFRTTQLATAAAEAASTVGRLNLTARGFAYGVAEEAMFQAVSKGLDPAYDPDIEDVLFSTIVSGALVGTIGGAAFGRKFVQDQVEDLANAYYRTRTVNLPGGYTIKYTPGLAFDSPSAADTMLFARGTGSFADEADRVGRELWDDWQRSPRRVDLSIPGGPVGARSAIKAAAFELSLAGVKLDANVFGSIARALVKAEATKTTAGAFNKVFWDEVLAEMPTGTTLRAINERTFVGGIDSTVRDLANREEMVTSVYDYFRRGAHLDPQAPRSLIFQVLQEIKERGGRVNRQVVAEVVDELRAVSQNPPRKTNARGAQRIDADARRAAVAQIINKRSKSDKEIFLPPSLLRNMTPQAGGRAVSIGGRMAGREPTAGTDREFRDVPKITEWFEGKIPVLKNVFNRSRRLHMSDNGAVRLAAHMIKFASASFDTAQPQTFIESGMQLLHRLEFSMMKVTRNGYVRFALGGGTENVHRSINPIDNFKTHFGAKGREMRRQFYTRVMAQLESGRYDDGVDAVNTTARELRKLLNETHDLAFKSGLKGFQTSATANYFPWLWRFDRIRRLASTEAGKQDLVKLIRQSWGDQRTVVIDGVEQTFTGDLDEAAKALAERLIRIANKSDNAPLIDQDQELADALAELEGPLKAQQGSRTPFGRSRIQLNRQAGITATADHLGTGRMNLTLQDLRNDDINFVMKKYLTSVVGAVTEKRFFDAFNTQLRARGIRGPMRRNAAGEMVESEVTVENGSQLVGLLNRIGPPMAADEAEALQTLLGALRFAPISDAVTIGDRVAGLVGAYMYLLRGGQFGLAAMTETGRLVGTVGMRTMFTQIPILNQMVSNWKNLDEGAENFSAMLDTLFAPSTDRMRRVFRDQLVQTDQFASRPQRVLDSLSNWYSDVSGLAPITSFTQQLAAAGAIQHLYDVAKGAAKRLDNATIRALGLEPAQYDQIIQYIGTNGVTRRNFLGLDQVTDIRNIDALEMDQVKAFVQRLVETRIQSVPTRGDFHDKVFSFWGRLLLQFKMFNLKGVDNFLFQNSSRVARGGGIQVSKEIAATGLIAGLMNYARSYADWKSYVAAGDTKRAEQTEEQLTLAGIARGALMGPSEFWAITTAGDMVWTNTIDPDPLFSPFKYSGMKAYEFPGQAAGVQALSLFRDVFGATAGASLGLPSERRITQGTVHRGRLLLPFQNYPGFKQLLNFAEQEVVDTYNLPKTQARDRD